MGVYDTVKLRCPECGNRINAQTKSTIPSPSLNTYDMKSAPIDVLSGIRDETFECDCGCMFEIKIQTITTTSHVHS